MTGAINAMPEQDYFIGIDGGGTSIRAVVTTRDLAVLGEGRGPSVNPNIVGHSVAVERIHAAARAALDSAGLEPDAIAAVGIGIAGAGVMQSGDWLRDLMRAVVPNALVVPASDAQIALAGARGELRGVLILAGTGSIAYGVNDAGESALVGGWGYLLGDEGSGYWLGLEAIRAAIHASEGRGPETVLREQVMAALELEVMRDLVIWLYRAAQPRTREIAALAPLVLEAASSGDGVAYQIINRAADALAAQARAVMKQLNFDDAPIAFAGGLLTSWNSLVDALCARLGLCEMPVARYTPAVGAALLAVRAMKAQPSG